MIHNQKLYIMEINTRMGDSLILYKEHVNDFNFFLAQYVELIQQTQRSAYP